MDYKIRSLYIHESPEYIPKVASLINQEWPRSESLRYVFNHMLMYCQLFYLTREASLQNSSSTFPLHIALIHEETDECVGHCKLSIVSSKEDSLLIESGMDCHYLILITFLHMKVVVDPSWRGKGLGRLVMEEAEKCAKANGKQNIVLSTHDKQDFYRKIGYTETTPVTSLGSNSKLLSGGQLASLLAAFGGSQKKGLQDDGKTWMEKNLS